VMPAVSYQNRTYLVKEDGEEMTLEERQDLVDNLRRETPVFGKLVTTIPIINVGDVAISVQGEDSSYVVPSLPLMSQDMVKNLAEDIPHVEPTQNNNVSLRGFSYWLQSTLDRADAYQAVVDALENDPESLRYLPPPTQPIGSDQKNIERAGDLMAAGTFIVSVEVARGDLSALLRPAQTSQDYNGNPTLVHLASDSVYELALRSDDTMKPTKFGILVPQFAPARMAFEMPIVPQ